MDCETAEANKEMISKWMVSGKVTRSYRDTMKSAVFVANIISLAHGVFKLNNETNMPIGTSQSLFSLFGKCFYDQAKIMQQRDVNEVLGKKTGLKPLTKFLHRVQMPFGFVPHPAKKKNTTKK